MLLGRRAPTGQSALVAAALLLASGGCGRFCGKRLPPDEAKKIQAQDALKRFFEALPGKDCKVLGPMLAPVEGGPDCQSVVTSLHRHGFRLVAILGAEIDGRDPEAVIVKARIEEKGREREAPLRMERDRKGWKLRL